MSPQIDAVWLAQRLGASTSRDLGTGLTRLIDGGELAPGVHLPTIREFARAAGVSPGTVMTAWSRVRDSGRLQTRRRGGTVVADPHRLAATEGSGPVDWSRIELSLVAPDPALQPDLLPALGAALESGGLHSPRRAPITDRLRAVVSADWPFPAQAYACVGGGNEALVLATAAAAGVGRIAVEEPVSPGYLDTLRQLGIEAVGVRTDEFGPTVASMVDALSSGVTAVILQPGGAYGLRGALSAARAAELAAVVVSAAPRTWIVEDDSIGPLSAAEFATLGTHLPDQVLRIRSYCKAFGIDLRSAVLGGAAELVERAVRLRSFGMASNSRILQAALVHLLEDRDTAAVLDRARARYRLRRELALRAFAEAGLSASAGPDGFVLWVRVPDETSALIHLARRGIAVAAGAKSFVSTGEGLLRVSVLQLPEDGGHLDELAAAVVAAVAADREYFD